MRRSLSRVYWNERNPEKHFGGACLYSMVSRETEEVPAPHSHSSPFRSATTLEQRSTLFSLVILLLCILIVFHSVILHPGTILYFPCSDILAFHYPCRFLLADFLQSYGELPRWNPYQSGGIPVLGDLQAGQFYPPNWLHCLVPAHRTAEIFGWVVVFHVLLGGLGMLWWLKTLEFDVFSRIVGALVFTFSAKWLLHVAVVGHVIFLPLAWLPFKFLSIDWLVRDLCSKSAVVLALLSCLSFLGYHPQLLFYESLLVLGYTVFKVLTEKNPKDSAKALTLFVFSVLLSLGLSAFSLGPCIEFASHCARGTGLDYDDTSFGSLITWGFRGILFPHHLSYRDWERFCYVGVLPLALLAFSLEDRGRRRGIFFFLGGFSAMVLYALGPQGYLHRFAYDYLPGFNLFRIPTRILLLAGFPLGYLAAAGCSQVLAGEITPFKRLLALLSLSLGLVLVWADDFRGMSLAIAFGLACPALALFLRSSVPKGIGPGLILILGVFVELSFFLTPRIQTMELKNALGSNPVAELVTNHGAPYRVYAIDCISEMNNVLWPCYSVPARIEMFGQINPLVPIASHRYVVQGIAKAARQQKSALVIPSLPPKSRIHLDLAGVRFLVGPRPFDPREFKPVLEFRDMLTYSWEKQGGAQYFPHVYVFENPSAFPRGSLVSEAEWVRTSQEAFESLERIDPRRRVVLDHETGTGTAIPLIHGSAGGMPGDVRVERKGNKIEVTCQVSQDSYLLLTEMWYPGWRASVDGSPVSVERAFGTFCAILLTPGSHRVEMTYCPRSYVLGGLLSLVTLCLCVFLSLKRTGAKGSGALETKDSSPTSMIDP